MCVLQQTCVDLSAVLRDTSKLYHQPTASPLEHFQNMLPNVFLSRPRQPYTLVQGLASSISISQGCFPSFCEQKIHLTA